MGNGTFIILTAKNYIFGSDKISNIYILYSQAIFTKCTAGAEDEKALLIVILSECKASIIVREHYLALVWVRWFISDSFS